MTDHLAREVDGVLTTYGVAERVMTDRTDDAVLIQCHDEARWLNAVVGSLLDAGLSIEVDQQHELPTQVTVWKAESLKRASGWE